MAEEMVMNGAAETAATETAEPAAAAGVVDPQGESAPATEQQATAEPSAAPADSAQKSQQSRNENSAYKRYRQKAEAFDGMSSGLLAYARSKGLQPKDGAEALEMLEAMDQGRTLEEHRKAKSDAVAEQERMVRESPLYKALQAQAEKDAADAKAYRAAEDMRQDLAAIQEVDPSVGSLEELGEEYLELVKAGVRGVNAYYAIKGKASIQSAAKPPATGTVGGTAEGDRDFTSEELDRLTPEQLKDSTIFEKAMRSLSKLKK